MSSCSSDVTTLHTSSPHTTFSVHIQYVQTWMHCPHSCLYASSAYTLAPQLVVIALVVCSSCCYHLCVCSLSPWLTSFSASLAFFKFLIVTDTTIRVDMHMPWGACRLIWPSLQGLLKFLCHWTHLFRLYLSWCLWALTWLLQVGPPPSSCTLAACPCGFIGWLTGTFISRQWTH